MVKRAYSYEIDLFDKADESQVAVKTLGEEIELWWKGDLWARFHKQGHIHISRPDPQFIFRLDIAGIQVMPAGGGSVHLTDSMLVDHFFIGIHQVIKERWIGSQLLVENDIAEWIGRVEIAQVSG